MYISHSNNPMYSFLIRTLLFCFIITSINWISFAEVSEEETRQANKLYKVAATDFHKLYDETQFRKYEQNWLNTIYKFHNIFKKYPKTVRAAQSLYNIGKLFRSLYKWNAKEIYIEKSNNNFLLLTKKYKTSYLADDALYEVAKNYTQIYEKPDLAKKYYSIILEEYPNSELASQVRTILSGKPTISNEYEDVGETKISSYEDTQKREKITRQPTESDPKIRRKPSDGSKIIVTKIDHWSTSEWTRIVINTDSPTLYKYNTLKATGKHRFYVDVLDSVITESVKTNLVTNDGIIKRLRASQFDPKTVRIVLELDKYSDIKIFTYELSRQFKIVLDVIASKDGVRSTLTEAQRLSKPKIGDLIPKTPQIKASDISIQKALGLKITRIIIDPGHGGRDSGAKRKGRKEKDITLKLGLELKKIIESGMEDIEVLLTRDRDHFVELEARTAFANKHKGDLFISIHVNAHESKKANGVETYFLNLTKDKDSLRLAAIENSASAKNVSDLQSILNDLMINSKLKESHALAYEVQNYMVDSIEEFTKKKIYDRGVKQAPFVVLLGATMPSILVEVGFISNAEERTLLSKNSYIKKLGKGIYHGIKSYINKYSAN